MSVVAWAQITASGITDILRQAKIYQFQFRTGQYDVAPKSVAMLEEATKANPDNADLSNAMGVSYLAEVAGVMLDGREPRRCLDRRSERNEGARTRA
jgi:hypothetical protein